MSSTILTIILTMISTLALIYLVLVTIEIIINLAK